MKTSDCILFDSSIRNCSAISGLKTPIITDCPETYNLTTTTKAATTEKLSTTTSKETTSKETTQETTTLTETTSNESAIETTTLMTMIMTFMTIIVTNNL